MYQIKTLKNGLTLITIDLPYLDSVTTLIAVGAGSRYENRKVMGISHFLEHMFFKGSKKYPTAEKIATLIDSIGAVNNAATGKEYVYYWIKSASKHIDLATDILSSMIKEPLFAEEEIEKEKGVILEEIRMYRDDPGSYVGILYETLQFGDQPLGWDTLGTPETLQSLTQKDLFDYMNTLYSPDNMVLAFVGKLPKDIEKLAEKYFADLSKKGNPRYENFKPEKQDKPKVNVFFKETEQVNLILGVEGFDRDNDLRFPARVLSLILGSGMSSRLFMQVRERRGLAYSVGAVNHSYKDTGYFVTYGGLKLEKTKEGLQVIKDELARVVNEKVTEEELQKAKDMERGRIALRKESTNFLAEHFALEHLLDKKIETFEDYMKKIDAVTVEDVQGVAQQLFKNDRYNLQIVGPFTDSQKFQKLLE